MAQKGETEFDIYYRHNLNLTSPEYEEFKHHLHSPLPLTFRVNNPKICSIIENSNLFKKVDYLSDFNVYQCNKEAYKAYTLRNFIIKFTDTGSVYRQEVASMLPVIYLDTQPHHHVLDMCAAPGSKTTMIIEQLCDGILVSNDSNASRCDVLKTHLNKYNFENVVVTNNDARAYPFLWNEEGRFLFDRILCDVPCSGDGTIRKNRDLVLKWGKNMALGLVKTQYEILRRGMNLLKDDGVLVYSTCSFNPVENECIVQRALVELDCELVEGKRLDGFKVRSGLKTWNPGVEKTEKNQWLFPNDNIKCLDMCMRIYPQDQDTGGFFIAILRKKNKKIEIALKINDEEKKGISLELNKIKEDNCVDFSLNINNLESKNNVRIGIGAVEKNKDLTTLHAFLKTDKLDKNYKIDLKNTENEEKIDIPQQGNKLLRAIHKDSDFYYVNDDLKKNIEDQLQIQLNYCLITQSMFSYTIRFVSQKVLEILKNTPQASRIISAGCKAFSINQFKNSNEISFRSSPGILEKLKYDEKHVSVLSLNDTLKLLKNDFADFCDLENKNFSMKFVVVKLYGLDGLFCAWCGKNKITIFLNKKYRLAYISYLEIKNC